jgi:RNA 3'-terminal phosphate cyclase (ATP)
VQLFILERGYYPKGGGLVEVIAEPSQLSPLEISGEEIGNGIVSCTSNLPDHVAERQAISARNRLHEELGFDPPVIFDRRSGLSTGSSCTAWRGAKGGLALGKRGFPAEKVGLIAADQLIEEVRAGGVVDTHLADQLLIYLAQYGGEYSTGRLTLHAQTMQWLLGEFGFSVGISAEDVVEMRG